MKKMTWLVIILLVVGVGLWAFKRASHPNVMPTQSSEAGHSDHSSSYFTCPMHPQIHQDHAGECPICHMKLVPVKTQEGSADKKADSRSTVQPTSEQLNVLSIQRYKVEKMTIKASIPISGRFISSNAVAFQIYESDLRYIKSGLKFYGESSFYPDEEVEGVISSVDSIVDPTSRTVRIVGNIKKGPRGVASETGFSGKIELDLKDRIAIPESSVLHTGTGDLIYLFGNGNSNGNDLTAKPIKLGLKSEGFYEVMSGVNPGDVISSGPNFLVDSESKIRGAGQ